MTEQPKDQELREQPADTEAQPQVRRERGSTSQELDQTAAERALEQGDDEDADSVDPIRQFAEREVGTEDEALEKRRDGSLVFSDGESREQAAATPQRELGTPKETRK